MVVANNLFIPTRVVNCLCHGLANKVPAVINKFTLFGRLIVKRMWVVITIGSLLYSSCPLVCRSTIVTPTIAVIRILIPVFWNITNRCRGKIK